MRSLTPIWMLALALTASAMDGFQEPTDRPIARTSTPHDAAAALAHERALLSESEAARRASDYATARAKAADVVTSLLAQPEADQGNAWLQLLNSAGMSSWYAQDAGTAKLAWQKVLEVRSRTLPDEHPDVQTARMNLALTAGELGDLQDARSLLEQVLEVRSRTLPDEHPDLQLARLNLAVTLFSLGDYQSARPLAEKVLDVRSRTLPDDHPDLQAARLNLAATLYSLGDLSGARTLTEKAHEVFLRTLPDDHPHLQAVRGSLAVTIRELGDLPGARALEEKVLEVFSRTLPDEHPDLQRARVNLAGTIGELGDLAGARALEEKVLEVHSRTLPDEHPDVQTARLCLAATIHSLGDLAGARSLEEKVLEIRSRTLPDEHPDLQKARLSLATTTHSLGDLARARVLEEKVLEVLSRTLPDDHPDLQKARLNLAGTIYWLGDIQGARALQEKVLEGFSRSLPGDHPSLQGARLDLAGTLHSLGDFSGARALCEKALEVSTKTLPDEHPGLQRARQVLAMTLGSLGDLPGALALEEKVLEVYSRTLPEDHPDLQTARGNLAATIAVQAGCVARGPGGEEGREEARERCLELVGAMCRSKAGAAREALLGSSRREAEERCARLADCLDLGLSYAQGCGVFDPIPALERASFELGETTRGAALASARVQHLAAGSTGYAELCLELRQTSEELAALVQQGTTSAEFGDAVSRREALERELVSLAEEQLGAGGLAAEVGVQELAGALGEREALVSFYRYTRFTVEVAGGLDATGECAVVERSVASLCALVLRSGERTESAPALLTRVELGPIEPIQSAVHAWRASLGVAPDARGIGVVHGTQQPGAISSQRGRELRRLVFDPLLPSLASVDFLVVALDDVLHLVPLDALPAEESGASGSEALLGERWRIETRVALSERLAHPGPIAPGGALVALGGVAYDTTGETDPGAVVSVAAAAALHREEADAGVLRGSAWSRGFAELPATAIEAQVIARHLREAFGAEQEIAMLSGSEATRERMIELAPRARWLHVATHGWFAGESIRSWSDPEPLDAKSGLGLRLSGEEEVKGMSPMLLCGLALAGANLPEDDLGRVRGLMTADEIAELDLSGCELAVLSACDTNVGERRAGQGVASLQRALQMAGARSVITSLWKVPDKATSELMVDFYRRLWIEKKPKWQALWEAKLELRNAVDAAGRPLYTTRDWAAWVLTGEPE